MSVELSDDEHAVLRDLFQAANQAHETHSIPAGDYTTRAEKLAFELEAMMRRRAVTS